MPKKIKTVASCPGCPFAMTGEEWHPVCLAPQPNGGKRRRLPEDHDPDGPPPSWCPLPIAVAPAPVDAEPDDDEKDLAIGSVVEAKYLRKGDCFRKLRGQQTYLLYQVARATEDDSVTVERGRGVSWKGTTTGIAPYTRVEVRPLSDLERDARKARGDAAELGELRNGREPNPGTPAALIAAVQALEGVERAVILTEQDNHVVLGVEASPATSEDEVREVARDAVPMGITVQLEWLMEAGTEEQPEKDAPEPERYQLVQAFSFPQAQLLARDGYQVVASHSGPYGTRYIMQRKVR